MRLLLLALAAIFLISCKHEGPPPPKMEACILSGSGSGACKEADGSSVIKPPSALKNYWATNPADFGNFVTWCYDAAPTETKPVIAALKSQIIKGAREEQAKASLREESPPGILNLSNQ